MQIVRIAHFGPALLVDDSGEVWPAKSSQLRQKLFCLNYPGDLESDLIRNLGFVGLRSTAKVLTVTFCPVSVAEPALARALYWIADQDPDRVCLKFVNGTRVDEIVGGARQAINRICQVRNDIEQGQRIVAIGRNLSDLDSASTLKPLWDHWRSVDGRCDVDDLKTLAARHNASRYAIIDRQNEADFVFREVGTGLPWLGAMPKTEVCGRPVASQVDPIYYRWVRANYNSTLASYRPTLTDVYAVVSPRPRGQLELSYRRLLLPCFTEHSVYLFSANSSECAPIGRWRQAG